MPERIPPRRGLVPGRRRALATISRASLALIGSALPLSAWASAGVRAARLWPAEEYTRVTLESAVAVRHELLSLKDPDRLVLDLIDVELGDALKALADKVSAGDPYIRAIRVGRFKPGVVRLVFDLKAEVKAASFALQPVADYGHRLVVDIYPARPNDPLMALVEQGGPKGDGVEAAPTGDPGADAQARSDAGGLQPGHAGEAQKQEAMGQPSGNAPSGAASRARQPARPYRPLIVAIDAGHGGEDPGARGSRGTLEKDVTLAIARRLRAQVEAAPGLQPVMIRDGDYFIPLGHRTAKARRAQADLFVSIHADAYITPKARGSSVFALSETGATSAAARWLADRENAADLIGGVNLGVKDPYLAKTLLDLSQTATINDSLKLAREVLDELGDIGRLHRGAVEQAGFAVLKSPDIPSILVETAFISNPDEEARLREAGYQEKMADAILSGIRRYLAKNPPLGRKLVSG